MQTVNFEDIVSEAPSRDSHWEMGRDPGRDLKAVLRDLSARLG